MTRRLPITEPPTDRDCGECQACCEVLSIRPTNEEGVVLSPAFQRCQFQCDAGCAIYKARPSPCAEYHCMWRLGFGDPVLDRPDRLGVVLEGSSVGWLFAIEARQDAYLEERVQGLMAVLRDPTRAENPATAILVTPWGAESPGRSYWDGHEPDGARDPAFLRTVMEESLRD